MTAQPQLSEQQIDHARECNGRKVVAENGVTLLADKGHGYEEIAQIAAGFQFHLEKIEQIPDDGVLPVDAFTSDSYPVVVRSEDIEPVDGWLYPVNHLLPMNFSVTLKQDTVLSDDQGDPVMTLKQPMAAEIFARKGDRIGIEFQGSILWADVDQATDVTQQEDLQGADEIPVLMYHFFYDESKGEKRKDVNFVEVNEFREQLQALQDEGYSVLTMQEVEMMMNGWAKVPERSVAITIDDGDPTVYQYAYPVLQEFGMNAVLFLISGWMEPTLPYEFIEMRENGLELQSHSFLMHQGGCKAGHGGRLLCVDHDEGVQDTIRSLDYVDGGTVYCYPFGDVNDSAVKILQDSGVHMAFTTEYGKIRPGMDLYRLPRIRVSGGAGLNRFIHNLQ